MANTLAIDLIQMGLPLKSTLDKIKADANEDLLKNNKYSQGKKEYLDTNTLRRMLNEAFNYQWSWEVLNFEVRNDGGTEYASVYGRLHLPGLGFRDAFGSARIENGGKKDNSAVFASASSYAFKNAVKQTGFASNLFDDNFDEDLWYDEFDDEAKDEPKPKKVADSEKKSEPKEKPKAEPKDEPREEKPKADKPKAAEEKSTDPDEFTDEQKADLEELRDIYKIKTGKQLIGFFQIWSKDIKNVGDITPAVLDDFLDYYDANEDEFEDFDPEEVA